MNDITGIVVCYNMKNLIERAYNSVRKFYPDMPIIIVDGSQVGNPCVAYVSSLTSDNTTVIHPGRNIGHGRGMHLGITHTKTKYALIFDSDIQMISDCVPAMLEKVGDDIFGIGNICYVDLNGNGTKPRPSSPKAMKYHSQYKRRRSASIPYLHPFFHLIDVQNYKKYKPYVHHGAPCLLTMYDIYKRGLSKTVLINFPDLKKCVKHDGRGTRARYRLDWRADPWQRVVI